ncbi:MAG: hypothetical protein JJ913_19045 [Rhizobiaceae bacterium]|nr:hypothetical protein [Rhizobiaceae bacterium]
MKLVLLLFALVSPFSAHATPIQLSDHECGIILKTLRNQIETIFLAEMTLAQFPRQDADFDAELREVRNQLSDALAHYDSKVARRGAYVLGEKCLGYADAPARSK